jgi:DNA polymerase (family 10)
MTNGEIAKKLLELSEYLEVQDVPFKPRAYARASGVIESLREDVATIYTRKGRKGLDAISGVGKGIAEKIEELITTGAMKELETIRKKFPVQVSELSAIEGVGPKAIKALYGALHIRTIADLERAAKTHTISALPHFGKKSEEKILKGIEFLKKNKGRMLLGTILPIARSIQQRLSRVRGVRRVTICGSIRRMQETVGDIDIVATSSQPASVMKDFVSMSEVEHIYNTGLTKTMIRLSLGIDADLRVVPDDVYGAAVQYFTGDKQHNIEVRKIAIKKGYKLSEYGLFRGKKLIAAKTEEEIYNKLGMQCMPPELRTASGEIEAARFRSATAHKARRSKHGLPQLISYGSIRGDLQVQTNWTDGNASIEEMARAAIDAGLSYIAITDHTKVLAMTGRLDERALARQGKEIDRLNTRFAKEENHFRILKSAEINILKDGSFDISDTALKKLDIVSAAVHSHFTLSEKEQTERIIRALKHPLLNVLFHPTGRLIGKREPYALDMGKIIRVAKEYGVALEVNASPERMDLKDIHIRMALEYGAKLVVNSDAHAPKHFEYLDLGVAQTRRGWGKRGDVLNTLPVEKLQGALKKMKNKRK